MSCFLAEAASAALSLLGSRKMDGEDVVMGGVETTWASEPASANNLPNSIRCGNGITKSRFPRDHARASSRARQSLGVADCLSTLVDERARLAFHPPMDVFTAVETAFDDKKAQFAHHYFLFEAWRVDPTGELFDNETEVERETSELKEVLDEFRLVDYSDPAELGFVHAWQAWYMLEVEEFLEDNAVSAAQVALKGVARGINDALRTGYGAACRLGL